MYDYKNYLNNLQNIAVAKVDAKKRCVLLYRDKILVFKKFGYNVALEMFIRLQDIQKYSYISTPGDKDSLKLWLIQRPNINKRTLTIPLKNASSIFDVNNFVDRLDSMLEETHPQANPVYSEWPNQDEECLDYDLDQLTPGRCFNSELEKELHDILWGEHSWIEYLETELLKDSPLRTDSEFVNCGGKIQKVLAVGIGYYKLGKEENYKAALECFKLAAESGDLQAALYLGECYLYGRGTECNPQYAMHWLCKAADMYESAYDLINECCKKMYGG